eukprot:scaffold76086_cov28-Attheya_sp.AAC.1
MEHVAGIRSIGNGLVVVVAVDFVGAWFEIHCLLLAPSICPATCTAIVLFLLPILLAQYQYISAYRYDTTGVAYKKEKQFTGRLSNSTYVAFCVEININNPVKRE